MMHRAASANRAKLRFRSALLILTIAAVATSAHPGAARASEPPPLSAEIPVGLENDIIIHTPVRTSGGIEFTVTAPDADSVSLVATWNDWDPSRDPMSRAEAHAPWRRVVDLAPSTYQFKTRYWTAGSGEWRPYPEPDSLEEEIFDESHSLLLVVEADGDVFIAPGEYREPAAKFAISGDYNRVDGAAPSVGFSYDDPIRWRPRVNLTGGYSFGLERGSYGAKVEIPFKWRIGPAIGGEVFQQTTHYDSQRITPGENFFAAFVISEDFRDYIRERGGRAFWVERFFPSHQIELSYAVRKFTTAARSTDWSVFGADKEFRENDLFLDEDEGTMRSIALAYKFDTRRDFHEANLATRKMPLHRSSEPDWAVAAEVERAGDEIGGDFPFDRWEADVRHYTKLSRTLQFSARAAGGRVKSRGAHDDGISEAAPPRQRRFYLGGLGTMRGREFKTMEGTRYALGNLEMTWVPQNAPVSLSIFSDLGDAWSSESDGVLHADLGLGASTRDRTIRLDVARPVDSRSGDTVRVTVRAARAF